MNTLNHFEHHGKLKNKEHFSHLVQVALVDGTIDKTESEMLYRLGRKLNLTTIEVNSMIESSKQAEFAPPHELSSKFEQMYDIIKLVLADGKIEDGEMDLSTNLAIKLGFQENEIPNLLSLLISGVQQEIDEDDLFDKFKKERRKNMHKL